ncbi:enoyl-CoA hydratase/isomerase family protein [Falsiroseomonas ponticola]|uniref:enoyl-CoA hydratase/isomerase family protein n=1 Tax=Falsiroseomonas ponticola TaxID=2786951 RepID=UPI0019311910|nr:enoyl-CoA hydratase/isomerase family protein [Roseomonas ponticola]
MGLEYSVRDGIAYFVIDNGKVNAITPQIHKDFYHRLKEFEVSREARVGILTGAHDRAFSAGDDIVNVYGPKRSRQELMEANLFPHQDEGETPGRPGWEHDVAMHRRYKPIIGAVNGWCLGHGMIYLLLHTDIRVAGENAQFGIPELNFGAAGISGTTRLARMVPPTAAAWMALTGDFIDAQEACRINLVNKVVPVDQTMATAEAIARRIIRHPPSSVRVEMESLAMGMDLSRFDAIQHSRNLFRYHRSNYEGWGSEPGFFAKRDER